MNSYVNRDEVIAVPEPSFTKTWHPVSHQKVLVSLELAIMAQGLEVTRENYSLSQDGMNCFGTLNVGGSFAQDSFTTKDSSWVVGFRNSMKKDFAVGVCAGLNVIVCSNMVFSGEYTTFRMHTSGLDLSELHLIAKDSIKKIVHQLSALESWHGNLRNTAIDNDEFKALTYDAMESGVISPRDFKKFLQANQEETALAGDQTAYTFHGAVTRMMRGRNYFLQADRNAGLNDLVSDYCHRKLMFRTY
jgi:hypothetical protein